MADLSALAEYVENGKQQEAAQAVQEALDSGVEPQKVLDEGLTAGMQVVGKKFKNNEVYVPEVLIAARAMQAGMDILEPKLAETGVEPAGTVVMGTVKGDLHDIGKNLVTMMLKGGGLRVVDVGIDVEPEQFVEKARESNANIVGLSALLTTTMPQMKEVVQALKDAGVDAKVIVGGAPVTQDYADDIGADGYAADAASAVDLANELIGRN
jgi:5-methyltetrahydrofolate--homocysteine methyltransferase